MGLYTDTDSWRMDKAQLCQRASLYLLRSTLILFHLVVCIRIDLKRVHQRAPLTPSFLLVVAKGMGVGRRVFMVFFLRSFIWLAVFWLLSGESLCTTTQSSGSSNLSLPLLLFGGNSPRALQYYALLIPYMLFTLL